MITVSERDLFQMFDSMLRALKDESDDPEATARIFRSIFRLAKTNPEWGKVLRAVVYAYLKFQKPGYLGVRDYAEFLLRPIDETRGMQIARRGLIQHAVHILQGKKGTDGEPRLGRGPITLAWKQQCAIQTLTHVMPQEEAEERVLAFSQMLGLT